jgi:carbon starvation protein
VATGILVKSGKLKYAWITALPLAWLVTITSTAAYQKIMSEDTRVGFFAAANDMAAKLAAGTLPPEKAAVAPQLIFNQHLDAWLTLFFVSLLWIIVLDMLRVCIRSLAGKPVLPVSESAHIPSRLVEDYARD